MKHEAEGRLRPQGVPVTNGFPEKTEAQRLYMLDYWIGWLRLIGFAGLALLVPLLGRADLAVLDSGRITVAGLAMVLYGAIWLVVMPRASPVVQRLVGWSSLVIDGLLITLAPVFTALRAEGWTPLWTLVAAHYVLRFGWRAGVAVGVLLIVSLGLQLGWPAIFEFGGAGAVGGATWLAGPEVLAKLVALISLGVIIVLLGNLVQQEHQLRQRLSIMAIRDGLTGLYNRRYFHESLQRELCRARRTGGTVSLLMIDLDQFKALNDAFGHPAGDEVLAQVASVIVGCIRLHDTAFRYGGEEFAVLLADAPPEVAARIAHRIRSALASHAFDYRSVTASVGWSSFPHFAETEWELIEQADAALYRAKEAGGNRVVGFHPPEFKASPDL